MSLNFAESDIQKENEVSKFSLAEKQSNPKDLISSDKLPLHLWPNTATAMGCLGLLEGACKYGRSNWRVAGVRASIYYDAAKRHLDAWFEGEELSPEGVPHLANALACLAIIVDAEAAGKLNDDRNVKTNTYYKDKSAYLLCVYSRFIGR